jgi:hypothetical protein
MAVTYQRKTRDVFELQGDYGFGDGFECLTTETTRKAARERLREYHENDSRAASTSYKIVRKREPIAPPAPAHDVPAFGDGGGYVCIGDFVRWMHAGYEMRATIRHDEDTKPTDFDCYSDDQVEAWTRDEWSFVGVVVTASKAEIELGSASLWGVDCNFPGSDNSYLAQVAADLQDEAVAAARAKLIEIGKG